MQAHMTDRVSPAMPECDFHEILTGERCCDYRCRPYHVRMPTGDVVEEWLCETHAFMLWPEAQPAWPEEATA